MNTKLICLALGAAVISTACTSASQKPNWGFGGSVGTTGAALEAKYAATDHLALRGSLNYLPISRDETIDGVDYEAELDMTTLGAFGDLYPFENGFHVSGGVYIGDKSVDLVGTPGAATVVEIGNETYTGAEIGTLVGSAEYADVAPFLGLGYDGFMNTSKTWSFNARAGVMFVGSPDVNLDAQGGLSSDFPDVQTELQREADNLQEELDDYKLYPVISLGVTRRF